MRDLINKLQEADIIPFPGRAKKSAEQGYTDDQKYRGAGATQASGLTKDLDPNKPFQAMVAGHIQDIFTTMAAGREITDEQKEKARSILKISQMSSKMDVHNAVDEILKAYNKQHPSEKVAAIYRSQEMAYTYDDEGYLDYRIMAWGKRDTIFSTKSLLSLYEHVFETYLPVVKDVLELPAVERWLKSLETLRIDPESVEDDEVFDPHSLGEYRSISPYVEKLVQKWGRGKGWISTDLYSGDPIKMVFHPFGGQESEMAFSSRSDVEAFIRKNEAKLDTWWTRQQARRRPSDAAQLRSAISKVRAAIIAKQQTGARPDADAFNRYLVDLPLNAWSLLSGQIKRLESDDEVGEHDLENFDWSVAHHLAKE